jgi:hypothetical protein
MVIEEKGPVTGERRVWDLAELQKLVLQMPREAQACAFLLIILLTFLLALNFGQLPEKLRWFVVAPFVLVALVVAVVVLIAVWPRKPVLGVDDRILVGLMIALERGDIHNFPSKFISSHIQKAFPNLTEEKFLGLLRRL